MTSSLSQLTDKISHGKIANLSAVTLKMPRERSSIERCQEDAYVTVADCCDARIMDAEDNETHFHDIEGVLTRDGYNNEVWHNYDPQPVADPSLDLLAPVPLCCSSPPARTHHELNANNFLIRRLIYIHRIKSNFMWQTIFHCDTSVYYTCTPPPGYLQP